MEIRTVELSPRRKKQGYQESDFQSKFTAWQKKNPYILPPTFGIELKVVNTAHNKSLSIRDFEVQQLPALQRIKTRNGIGKKLSDLDQTLKPFDYFFISCSAGLIGVEFYTFKQPHYFYVMDVDVFLNATKQKGKPYLNEKEIAHIATRYDL